MKLLLDTHVWVWARLAPERLVPRVAAALQSTKNELWFSPISVWEVYLLIERGRLEVAGPATAWIQGALARVPMHEAKLSAEIALLSRTIDVPHQDPADRFLAATAASCDLTLVTADAHLLRGKGYRTLANA